LTFAKTSHNLESFFPSSGSNGFRIMDSLSDGKLGKHISPPHIDIGISYETQNSPALSKLTTLLCSLSSPLSSPSLT
jgi:hypothetical protein